MQIELGQGHHSFLVRVWTEPREIAGTTPRTAASVQELLTGESRYVRTMTELQTFMRACVEATGAEPGDWWSQ